MMLRNIFLKSLRDNRVGVLTWGAGLGLLMAVGAAQYTMVVGEAGPARARMAAELTKAFESFSFIMGEITSLETIGGFLTTRVLGFAPVMLGLWIAVVAVGLIRGEEQQGALDMLLSTPRSRMSVLKDKLMALAVLLVAALALLALGLVIGVLASGEPLPAAELGLAMINMAAITAFWAAVGLLLGQLVLVRRTASSIAGGLIFGTFLVDNLLTGLPTVKWIAWLLPFRYYTASKPLVPGRSMEWGAWLALVVFTIALTALAAVLFVRRDIGSTFRLFPSRAGGKGARSGSSLLLGSVFGKSVRDLAWPMLSWSLGLALYVIMIVSTVNEALEPMREIIRNASWMAQLAGSLATPEAYISFSLFTYLPVLLAAFAITQIGSWSGDEEEGRLELVAGMPLPRWQLLAARYSAILLSLVMMLAATGMSLVLGAEANAVPLDAGRVWQSLVASLPIGLVVAAFGLCVATWLKRPGAAVPVTIAVVVLMFFLELFAGLFGFPDEVLNLSIFHLLGRPLADGVQWGNMLALMVGTLLLGAGSFVGLNRRDIAK